MYVQRKFINSIRAGLDYLALITSFLIASHIDPAFEILRISTNHLLLLFLLIIAWYFSSSVTGLYDDFRSRNYSFELIILVKNIFIQLITSITVLFMLKDGNLSRAFVVYFSTALFFQAGLYKYILRKILYFLRSKGRNLRNILLIGGGEVGHSFMNVVRSNPQFGYNLVGILDDVKHPYLNGEYLGKISELEKILNNRKIDSVIVSLPNNEFKKIEDIVSICDNNTVRTTIIPDYFQFVSDKYNVSMFGRFPVINVREDKLSEIHWRFIKRTFDIVFSLLIMITIFSWLFPIIAIAIKLNSKGPVFFKQERWGRNNKKFAAYKFRSMKVESCNDDSNGKFIQATKDDPRITKVGKFLRKTNLDELPQFINVLKGDMTIVGPRPHPTPLNVESKDKVNLYMVRHLVKPGITGWAQVNGYRGETKNIAAMQKRIGYDLWYIENWSFWLDIQIIFLTCWRMVVGDPNAY